ncbi:MATE family efflux transporter [uncultured Phascolarctobacterium sp.]|uniref:MATE family efflux transporter n=1 Tax=uncultured Phascolarctobacterium sp. TaxID=512296 RepID=UPI0025FF324E|nr:MATE family efflux transporter [uncultured Phascolarctobacterium sp.]
MLQNMTEGAPLKLIIPFMVPLLIGNVFQQLYNIADIIIVGRTIGVEALAAVGAVSPLFMMTMVLTIGLSNGFTVVTGQRYGARDMNGMRRSIGTCIVLSVFFVLLIMGVMHLVIDPVLVLMNIPQELLPDAYAYVMIIVDGLFAMMGYNLLSGIMRSLGDSKTPLYFLIVSSVVNVALALVFIIYLGWGVPGSAIALVIAQAVSAILCAFYIYKRFPQLHIGREDFNLDWPEIWAHLRMGLPMAVQFSVLGMGIIILQSVCNKFGGQQIAGFTTAIRVEQLALQPMISFGIAMAVFTAQNFGARRFDRIREAVRRCSVLSFAFSVVAAALLFMFGEEVIGVFLDDPAPEVLEAAHMYIAYTVPAYFFLSQIFIYRNACQGMGIGMIPMLAGCVELIMRSAVAVYLSGPYGFMGVCIAEPVAWISCSIFVFASYHYFIRVLEKKSALSA